MRALRLAVVGDPVAHSRSPEIVRGLMIAANVAGTYDAIRVAAGDGARAFAELRASGYSGLNVTTPLKEEALAAAQTLDDVARAARSVNVLVLGTSIAGYNTDGLGALGALKAAGIQRVRAACILVLGAGPTARAAVAALRESGATAGIWNRTREKSETIIAILGAEAFERSMGYDAVLSTLVPDVKPAEVDPDVVAAIGASPIVIDANYGSRATFAANFHRPDAYDGAAMLEASAHASFEIFVRASFTE